MAAISKLMNGIILFLGAKNFSGRVPHAINEAILENASFIFWGTGASEKNGLKESEYTFNQTVGPRLSEIAKKVSQDTDKLFNYLQGVSYIDRETQNTKQEITLAIKKCLEKNIAKLILVSSPTHIARCLQEALKIKEADNLDIRIHATASQTCFANSTAADVTIFEPPHRGDRPKIPFHTTLRGVLPFLQGGQNAEELHAALIKLFDKP